MTSPCVYMFHGYTSYAEDHWFPWLEKQVESHLKIPFKKLNFPDANHPVATVWDQYCQNHIVEEDGITLVGHSLGCIQVLRYLEQTEIHHVNLLLVSGFDEPIWTLPELDSFVNQPVNYQIIHAKVRKATVISALNDPSVPYPYTLTMARHLHAKFVLMPTGHHFTDSSDDQQLPVAFEELRLLLK
ncbi:hypothetical protein YK48G_05330 [Lentilactobacillus fungorum]|uniref:Serine hydrolase family protein n=1 Tax=Lentilactobacillus fungorum TaxID=2201250 RepID=A0ABQ3VWQ9_9LACO|nr:alpha/beta hydrolase [Lentilactobacillus fungorum]GHP13108.1 hypothetical protein YK48G_05330 [Lentilactobacillus fungorum]